MNIECCKLERRIIRIDKNDNEIIIDSIRTLHKLEDAISELEKLRKMDLAMYRVAVQKCPKKIELCDDWHNDVSYMFRINSIVIEAEIIDAENIALKMFELD